MKLAIAFFLAAFSAVVSAQTVISIPYGVDKTYTARAFAPPIESGDSNAVTIAKARVCTSAAPCVLISDPVEVGVTACRLYEGATQVGADQPLAAGACRFTLVRVLPPPANFRLVP